MKNPNNQFSAPITGSTFLTCNSLGQPEWKPILELRGENSLGMYHFGDMSISSSKKPNRARKWIMDKVFDIKWTDNPPPPMTEEEKMNHRRSEILSNILKKKWYEKIIFWK